MTDAQRIKKNRLLQELVRCTDQDRCDTLELEIMYLEDEGAIDAPAAGKRHKNVSTEVTKEVEHA